MVMYGLLRRPRLTKGVSMPRAVILTALQLEYLAVRNHLDGAVENVHPEGTVYERGTFGRSDDAWEVLIAQVGMGNQRAALETERALSYFNPHVAMFVGVAGGLKDLNLGDVVAASKVYAYEYGKAGEAFQPRAEIGLASYPLEQRAMQVARDGEWQRLSIPPITGSAPKAIVKPLAAGAQVVASNRSETYKFLRQAYSDAAAVEMEGHGFLEAARATTHVHALVIRGISDLVEGKEQSDSVGWQPKAASHAAAFAFEVLTRFQAGQKSLVKELTSRNSDGTMPKPATKLPSLKARGVPPSRLGSFTGRHGEFAQIHDVLSRKSTSGPVTLAIHGLSGVGKTQLCREYMELHHADYELTYWIAAGEEKEAISSLAQLAADLQLPGFDPQDTLNSSRVALRWLEQNDNWLLIFDNAAPHIVASLLPSRGLGHILVSSNDPHWSSVTNSTIRLLGLSPKDAIQFLKRRTGLVDSDAADRIASAFDYLPLALEQAAAYIETTSIDFNSYEKLLAENRPVLLDKKSRFTEYPESVYSALDLNVYRASENLPHANELLRFVSYLRPHEIPRELMRDAMGMYFEQVREKFDDFIFNELVSSLSRASLIFVKDKMASTHPLVQAFVRDHLTEDTQTTWPEFVLGALANGFPADINDSSTWPQCELLINHVVNVIGLANRRLWDDEAIESLYIRAGSYLHARGREKESCDLLGDALDQLVSRFGADSPEVAKMSNNLLEPLAVLGRSDEALELGHRAVQILTRDQDTLETHIVDFGIICSTIGRIYLHHKNELGSARLWLHRALSIHVSILGESHYTTAIDINNLGKADQNEAEQANARGMFYEAERKMLDAYQRFSQAVRIHRSMLASSDYRLAVALFNLGAVARRLERYTEAEIYLREAVEINDRLQGGATQWDQMDALLYLGRTLSNLGKTSESLVYFDRALEIATSLYGRNDPLVMALKSMRGDAAFDLVRPFFCYYTGYHSRS